MKSFYELNEQMQQELLEEDWVPQSVQNLGRKAYGNLGRAYNYSKQSFGKHGLMAPLDIAGKASDKLIGGVGDNIKDIVNSITPDIIKQGAWHVWEEIIRKGLVKIENFVASNAPPLLKDMVMIIGHALGMGLMAHDMGKLVAWMTKDWPPEYKNHWLEVLDKWQYRMNYFGMIPGVGNFADILNAYVYAMRAGATGDPRYTSESLEALVSAIPAIGILNAAGRLAKYSQKAQQAATKVATKIPKTSKAVGWLARGGEEVGSQLGYELGMRGLTKEPGVDELDPVTIDARTGETFPENGNEAYWKDKLEKSKHALKYGQQHALHKRGWSDYLTGNVDQEIMPRYQKEAQRAQAWLNFKKKWPNDEPKDVNDPSHWDYQFDRYTLKHKFEDGPKDLYKLKANTAANYAKRQRAANYAKRQRGQETTQ